MELPKTQLKALELLTNDPKIAGIIMELQETQK